MPNVKIEGNLDGRFTVNGRDFSALYPRDFQKMLSEIASPNYRPMDGWVAVGRGSKPWLIRARTPDGSYRELIDCQTMYSAANFGHGNMRILPAVCKYLLKTWTPTGNSLTNNLQLPALFALRELVGFDCRIITKTGGGEIVDTAIKTARRFWWTRKGRPEEEFTQHGPFVVVAENAFHGRPLGATSLFPRGSSNRKGFGPFPNGTLWVPFNDVKALENLSGHDDIAGVLLEPIQGEGGVIVPDGSYLKKVAELCRKNKWLFMLDEIQTGFGRTGKNFAFEHFGVEPDILLLGKALGAGTVPVSALLAKKSASFENSKETFDILSVLAADGPGEEGATWAGAALTCMAVLSSIQELCGKNIAAHAAKNGGRFIADIKLLQEKYPRLITGVRGKGLMVGVDFSVSGRALSSALLTEGVWASYTGENGQTLRFLPPLTTPVEIIADIPRRLEKALRTFL